jgi:uncharacterized HAD superfamily protein
MAACSAVQSNSVRNDLNTSPAQPDAEGKSDHRHQDSSESTYEKFLLSEYNHVAQAHFNTGTTITQFFQYYLLVVTIPITLAGAVLKISTGTLDVGVLIDSNIAPFLAVFLMVIAVVGLCMLAYITNLRLDALLYARTINGIRKYFTARSTLSIDEELWTRTLPRAIHQPRYGELRFFVWVVLAFAFMNSLYAYAGTGLFIGSWSRAWWAVVPFFILHFMIYAALVGYRERRYLRTHIIGLDIDGVISDQLSGFVETLARVTGKSVRPDAITKIPVHECQGLEVTEDDEHNVFNRPEYWTGLKVHANASRRIEQLKDVFGFQIHIFTYRPWPNQRTLPDLDFAGGPWRLWLPNPLRWLPKLLSWLPNLRRWLPAFLRWLPKRLDYASTILRRWAIKRLTRDWLKKHGIKWDRFMVEYGNVDMADSRAPSRNRFIISQKREIRIFVDDDLLKARKLANICELVFLFDQPYNRGDADLPSNLIRVGSWDEIYRYIREKL